MPSRNGKKASDDTTESTRLKPAFCALIEAMRVLSTRLICPAPTPNVWPFLQNTMALDFTYFATRQANSKSCSCSLLGCVLLTTLSCEACTFSVSGDCTSRPPLTRFTSYWLCALDSGTVSTRTFCFAAVTLSAASEALGAMMSSTNWLAVICVALSASNSRLKAMMPPNAEVVSVA